MQSSTALARCESMGSDNERDLTKVDEETFREDLLLTETTPIALATFAPSLSRNLTGDNLDSLCNLKAQHPMILFLFPNTLSPPLSPLTPLPCLRNMVGFSLESGLKHTLLLFLNIWATIWDFQLQKSQLFQFPFIYNRVKQRETEEKQRRSSSKRRQYDTKDMLVKVYVCIYI